MTIAITLRSTTHTTTARQRRWARPHDDVVSRPADIEFTWANRRPGSAGFARWAAAVGQRIDEQGLSGVSRDVVNVIAVARQRGVAPVAVDVLGDPTQPEAARVRAFGMVVAALVGP